MEGHTDIRCPRCGWRPRASDRWSCLPDCGAEWNTFWTRGVCPDCRRVWQDTQCPACNAFSPHTDWYVGDDGSARVGGRRRALTTPR